MTEDKARRPGANITAEIRTYEHGVESHIHDFAQLVVPLAGELEMKVGDNLDRLCPNQVIFISPNAKHEFESSQNGEFMVFDFEGELLPFYKQHGVSSLVSSMTPTSWRYAQFLRGELKFAPGEKFEHQVLLQSALKMLLEGAKNRTVTDASRLNKALVLLSKVDAPTTIGQIARALGLSQSSLSRLIVANTGKSPKTLQQDAKFALAIELLLETTEQVSVIAYEIGYENVSSFTNSFVRRFGVTPTAFRLKNRKDQMVIPPKIGGVQK